MKLANNAPIYVCSYAGLAEVTRQHGYALAIHGSVGRDFDLCCIPWTDAPSDPQEVVDAIQAKWVYRQIGEPEKKKHGRICYTMSAGFGDVALDLSFMPRLVESSEVRPA